MTILTIIFLIPMWIYIIIAGIEVFFEPLWIDSELLEKHYKMSIIWAIIGLTITLLIR